MSRQPAVMDYELGHINQLYDEIIQALDLPRERSEEICKELKQECLRIPTLMLHSKLPAPQFKVMVQRHLHATYLLLNSISQKLKGDQLGKYVQFQDNTEILKKFQLELQHLNNTIREYFPNDIDVSHAVSLPELTALADHLSKKIGVINLAHPDPAYVELTELLTSCISQENLAKIKLNYAQSEYLSDLLENLKAISDNSLDHILERHKNLLIEHGFNAPAFYSYCCIEIIKKRDNCQDISESYKEMLWIKKRLEQLVPYKGKCFHKKLPDIKKSLLRFLDAEISHLDTLEKIAGELARSGSVREDFKVSLSVKELAFFIHLQVECGIIIEEKPKKIHEYITNHYSTKETSKISEKSFKNAYYSHSRENIAKITSKLAEMLARAQQKS